MLWLLEAPLQPLPPIQVTVQQPPGLPVWVTAVISAAVGAFLGMITGAVMEFAKPAIAKSLVRRLVKTQLLSEFASNMLRIDGVCSVLRNVENKSEAEQKAALYLAREVADVKREKLDFYLENQKEAVFDFAGYEGSHHLYTLLNVYATGKYGHRTVPSASIFFEGIADDGCKFLAANGIKFRRGQNTEAEMYKVILDIGLS